MFLSIRKGNQNHQLGRGYLVHHKIISAFKTVEFASERMSCIVLRGHWCSIVVWNVIYSAERSLV